MRAEEQRCAERRGPGDRQRHARHVRGGHRSVVVRELGAVAELQAGQRDGAQEVGAQQTTERVPLDVLHLELGLHADTDTEARKLLPEGRVLDVRVAVAFVEPARRQEGIAPDGGGGGVEERDLARLSDVRPAHPQVLVLAHEVAVAHRGRLDADETVHVAPRVAVRETRERVRGDHDIGVDEEQERAARGARAHVARGCRADASRRRHDADREIRRDRRRLVG